MIKKLIQRIGMTALCFLLFLLPVKAADPAVSLTKDGNDVKADLELTDTVKKSDIVSLKVSFEVDKKPSKEEVSFVFDSGIKSQVTEYRYNSENGRLNIYISGIESLFGEEDDKFSLGKIVLSDKVESTTVSVVKDSLVTVNSAFDMEEIKLEISSVEAGGNTKPEETVNPGDSTNPGEDNNNNSNNYDDDDDDDSWESNHPGTYPQGPGSNSNYIQAPVSNTIPKPGNNVNPSSQEPANTQNTTKPTASNQNNSQTTISSENNQSTESSVSQSLDTQNNSQTSANNQSNNQQPNGNKNSGQNQSSTTGIPSSNIEENMGNNGETTAISLLESQSQGEETTKSDTTVESESTEAEQETVPVSNQNEENSSGRNTWLMVVLGFILVVAVGGAVFVFKITEVPKKKKR